jgi:hypothetical protein
MGMLSAQGGASDLHCVEEMLLPGYGSVARKARNLGTVTARVLVGQHGDPAKIETQGPDQMLQSEVEVFLKHNTKYLPACKGETVEILFTFELVGQPVRDPIVRVTFRGPNHFVLRSQPEAPIVDYLPGKRRAKDRNEGASPK